MLKEFLTIRFENQNEACAIAAENARQSDIAASFPEATINAAKQMRLLVPVDNEGNDDLLLRKKLSFCYDMGASCSSSSMVLGMHYASLEMLDIVQPTEPEIASEIDLMHQKQSLIASVTTEFGNNGDVSKTQAELQKLEGRFLLSKKTPICSYLEQADLAVLLCKEKKENKAAELEIALFRSEDLELTRLWDWNAIGMRGTQSHGFEILASCRHNPILTFSSNDTYRAILTPASHLFWAATWFGIFDAVLNQVIHFLQDGKSASRGALRQATKRSQAICSYRNELLGDFHKLLARYEQLKRQEAILSSEDAIRFNELKVNVSTRLSHGLLDLMTILGTRFYSAADDNEVWRKFRDLMSSMFMISNDLLNANNEILEKLGGIRKIA